MGRALIAGTLLLFSGAIAARSLPAGKTAPLVFVFHRVDRTHDVAILRPMIAPDIGVQLDSGPRMLELGTVLRCEAASRTHGALVEGQVGKVTELMLDCGERKFVVRTLDFSPRAK
jgi:hypothetical protein